jgi:predicted RNA-binding protein associated with RNAse of E/G family
LLWPEGHGDLICWYVNLEEPLRRTASGFDYMDQTLDIVISPDLSEWHWKDEDELAGAVSLGMISGGRAKELRAEGERVAELMKARKSPFDGGWESWRPDETWPVPKLPRGWDEL